MFVNRLRELESLARALPEQGARLFVLYGRRRVGKTELLKKFFSQSDRPYVMFTGDLGSSTAHVRGLSRRLGEVWGDPFLLRQRLSDWRSLIDYVDGFDQPLDLVLDEFPYLCEAEPALPSLLQNVWDASWRQRPVRLVLSGSSVGFMEREVLGERSPLFGRRTGQMRLDPMDFWSSRLFLEAQQPAAQVEFFACFGGTPAYLEKLNPAASLRVNIQDLVLDRVAYLYDEPRLLLTQELREPRNYFAILASVAGGNTRLNDIVQDCGLDRGMVSRYLDTLIGLELVEREVPITEKDPSRSRRGLYALQDPYFRFWFRFVLPNLSDLVLLDNREAIFERYVNSDLDHFVSPVFEKLCRDWIRRRAAAGQLDLRSPKVGRWWDGHNEIDAVAYDEKTLLLGECKWSRHPVGPSVLRTLESRTVPGLEAKRRRHILFSRSGFQNLEASDDLLLVDLNALVEDRMP